MLKLLCGDSEGRAVPMTLGCCRPLGNLLMMQMVCPLLFRAIYLLQPCLRLCLFVCLGLYHPEISWW